VLTQADSLVKAFYDDGNKVPVDERIEAGHQVINSFGHAVVFNSINSSRYGKLTKLYYQFADEDIPGPGLPAYADSTPLLCGAKIETLMFEKSRVTASMGSLNERNFHVFYQLLAARDLEELKPLKKYGMGDPRHFRILLDANNGVMGNPAKDKEAFMRLWTAMLTIDFADYEILGLFRILLGLLHLGNVEFSEVEDDETGEWVVVLEDGRALEFAARCLEVDSGELFSAITEVRKGKGMNQRMVSHSRAEALSARNKMIQCVYEAIFRTIYHQVNLAMAPPKKAIDKRVRPLPYFLPSFLGVIITPSTPIRGVIRGLLPSFLPSFPPSPHPL
jgi:myosin heavy subunit